ncbi:inactive tyrosine-protein kinase PRAG1-like isoform X4 [Bolinopsis microptera]
MTTTVSNHSNSTNSLHNHHGAINNITNNNNNISPHASSTTINSTHSNCSQHGQRVHVCKHFISGNKKALTEILKMLNTRHTVRDDLSLKGWSDYLVCSSRILVDTEKNRGCYKVRCANTDNLALPQRVYLAKIQCSSQQDAQQRMCFENDFKISSALPPHPNITTSYARFSDKVPENLPDFPYDAAGRTDSTFVISDFLSEGNLRSFVKENQHLLEHRVEEYEYEVCLLLLQLFRALHHLHENKAVHRDLKLENVSVGAADHPGGGKRLSLCNFGYSLYQPEKSEPFIVNPDDSNTWLGGNIPHLPPEILNPSEEITELDYTKADVFGAGCMIYEMLNLMNPFEGDDSLIKKVYSQSDLPLIPKRSRYSYALDRLVCLLLRHKPSKRISAKRAGDLVEVMLWGPEELRGSDRAAAEQMAAEWLEQQRSEILSNLALKLAENFTPQGSRVQNSAGFSLEDELKCKFLRETSARALTTNLYLLSQCQRAQQRGL